jgi:hypothetical protein
MRRLTKTIRNLDMNILILLKQSSIFSNFTSPRIKDKKELEIKEFNLVKYFLIETYLYNLKDVA